MGVREKYVQLGFKENGKFIRKQVALGLGKHRHIYKTTNREGGLMDLTAWSLSGRMP